MAIAELTRQNGKLIADRPFRWTINRAVTELKVTANKVRGGLRRLGVQPGPDGKFSTRDIFNSLNDLTALERDAKRAKLEAVIDEAKFQRNRRAEQEGRLVDVQCVNEWVDDCQLTIVTRIRLSKMPDSEKQLLLDLLTHNVPSIEERAARHNGKAGRRKRSSNGRQQR